MEPRLVSAAGCASRVCNSRRVRPLRIVEIEAGHSTRFLARAIRDSGLNTGITSFDPEPRSMLNGLSGVELICRLIQSAGSYVVPELVAGDMLFVGSSHNWHPGSDVAFLFNDFCRCSFAAAVSTFTIFFCPVYISCPSDTSTARRTSCRRCIGEGERLADRIHLRACGLPFGGSD